MKLVTERRHEKRRGERRRGWGRKERCRGGGQNRRRRRNGKGRKVGAPLARASSTSAVGLGMARRAVGATVVVTGTRSRC
eukprot:SAG31_NODE_1293_length_8955_cov_100.938911_3_plen_80_part_00